MTQEEIREAIEHNLPLPGPFDSLLNNDENEEAIEDDDCENDESEK